MSVKNISYIYYLKINIIYNKMERQPWLDNIKFFAIFCVVLGHTLGFLTRHEIAGYEWIQGVIVSFNMPLFFMLSGFSSGKRILGVNTFQQLYSLFHYCPVKVDK